MKKLFTIMLFLSAFMCNAQNESITKKEKTMKLNAGILTEKLAESKKFYTEILDFTVAFENDFYLLLNTPDNDVALSFLLPNHPTQQPFFHAPYAGQGMYLTIEVEDVDALYKDVTAAGIEIKIEIRDEPWGDRHFAIQDPNGIGIDIVRYTSPGE